MKKFNPKKILSYILLGVLVIFILVLTWIPLIFDIEHLNADKWITSSLINTGIMISAIILGEIFGEDKFKEKIDGLFQKALKKFNDLLNKLTNELKIVVYFSQFYNWFKARELRNKKESYLVDHGFDQMVAHNIIRYINKEDLGHMRAGVVTKVDEKTGKEIKFLKIDDEEYEVLKVIYSTEFTIDAPYYTYYLSAFSDGSSKSILEQAKALEKKERLNKTFNRTFKICLSLFISFIWGMATVQEVTEGGMKEAVVNTISRMIALIGGLLSGVLTAIVAVKLASKKLDNKSQVLTFMEIYYENKEFIPKTYDELVEEEIKKEEEAKAKVITPEPVEEPIEKPVEAEEDTTPKLGVEITPLPYLEPKD